MGSLGTLGAISVPVGTDIKGLVAGLNTAEAKSKSAAARMGTALGKFAKVGTLAFVAVGAAATKMSIEFETSMARIGTLIPGQTKRLGELKSAIEDTSVAFGQGANDVAEGAFEIVSAFGDAEDTVQKLNIAVKASKAGFTGTLDAVKLLAAVTKGYGDTSAGALEKVADLAFETVRLGQTTFPELAVSIQDVVANAVKLNVSQEELFAGFAALTGVTGDTNKVATQLAAIMRAGLRPTDGMRAALKALEVESVSALIAQEGLAGALDLLISKTDGTEVGIAKLFGRVEALTAVFALTETQADKFAMSLEANKVAANAANKAYGEVEKTTAQKLAVAQQKLAVQMREMGDEILPDLITALEAITPVITGIIKGFGEIAKGIGKIAEAGEGLGVILGGVTTTEFDRRLGENANAVANFAKELRAQIPLSDEQIDKLIESGEASLELKLRLETLANSGVKLTDTQKKFVQTLEDTTVKFKDTEKAVEETTAEVNKNTMAWVTNAEAQELVDKRLAQLIDEFQFINRDLGIMFGLIEPVEKQFVQLGDRTQINLKNKVADAIAKIRDQLRITQDEIEDADFSPPEDTPIKWGDVGAAASDAFGDAFKNTLRNIGDLGKATSIAFGEAFSASLAKVLEKNLGEEFFDTLGGKITGAFLPVIGQLAGGLLSKIGGFLFGGGDDEDAQRRKAEIAARAEAARKAFEAMFASFKDDIRDVIEGTEDWGKKLDITLFKLKTGGADLTGVMENFGSVIAGQIDLIKDMEIQFAALPDTIVDSKLSIDDMRRAMFAIEEEARDIRKEFVAGFAERAVSDAVAAFRKQTIDEETQIKNLTETEKEERKKRLADLAETERDARDERLKLESETQENLTKIERKQRLARIAELLQDEQEARAFRLRESIAEELSPEELKAREKQLEKEEQLIAQVEEKRARRQAQRQFKQIRREIREAQRGEGRLAKEIRFREEREILRGIDDPLVRTAAEQLIEQKNAATDREFAIEQQKESIRTLKESRQTLKQNLPKMKERLANLQNILERLRKKGPDRIHEDLEDLKAGLKNIGGYQHGGIVPRTGLAMVHEGERVIPKGKELARPQAPQIIRLTLDVGGMLKEFVINTMEGAIDGGQSRFRPGTVTRQARLVR
jgi:TP901 family phage tail tape measure protein